MRLARRVAAGLVLGALIGFLAALLRPRSIRTDAASGRPDQIRVGGDRLPPASAVTSPLPNVSESDVGQPSAPSIVPPQPVIGGTA